MSFYWEQTEKLESVMEDGKKRKVDSLTKNRNIKKKTQVDMAEYLSTQGTPISAHQCMVTLTAAPMEEKYPCSIRELEDYEDVRGGGLLFCRIGDEE